MVTRSAALAVLGAAVLAGCGAPSEQEYRSSAGEVCSSLRAEAAKVPAPRDASGLQRALSQGAEISGRAASRLEDVEPPTERAQDHFLLVDALRDLASAQRRGDEDGAQRAQAEVATVARRLGLDACAG